MSDDPTDDWRAGRRAVALPIGNSDEANASVAVLVEAKDGIDNGSLSAGGWVVLSRIASQLAQFLIVVIAARFMQPAEFGVFALISAISIGLTRLSEAGWREFIMSSRSEEAATHANTLAALSGCLTALIGAVAGGIVAMTHGTSTTVVTIEMLSLWVLLTTLSAAQAGILIRRRRLKLLAQIQIVGECVGFLIGVWVLAQEGGLLGLAAAKLASQMVVFTASLVASRLFPLEWPHGPESRAAYQFSRKILVTRIVTYAQENFALFVIGIVVGPTGAGLFRAASRFSSAVSELVSEPIRQLAWSALQKPDTHSEISRLLAVAVIVATPLFVGMAMTSDEIILLILGTHWEQAGPLLVAFALAGWLSIFNAATEPMLAAVGRIDILPRLTFASTALTLISLLAFVSAGITWIALGQLIAAAIILPVVLWIQHRYARLSLRRLAAAAYPALVGALALCAGVWLTAYLVPAEASLALGFLARFLCGAAAYIAAVLALVPFRTLRLGMAQRM